MLRLALLFIHVLAIITFFLGHGAGIAMAFRLRKETSLERMQAVLDLSGSTLFVYLVAYLLLGITGITNGFLIRAWNQGWLWLAIALMLFVLFWMFWYNESHYKVLRKLAGLPYMQGNRQYPAEQPASPEVIAEHIRQTKVSYLVLVGYVIPAFVLFLMIFRPF